MNMNYHNENHNDCPKSIVIDREIYSNIERNIILGFKENNDYDGYLNMAKSIINFHNEPLSELRIRRRGIINKDYKIFTFIKLISLSSNHESLYNQKLQKYNNVFHIN
jgi:hypothetical protein